MNKPDSPRSLVRYLAIGSMLIAALAIELPGRDSLALSAECQHMRGLFLRMDSSTAFTIRDGSCQLNSIQGKSSMCFINRAEALRGLMFG